MKRPAAPSDERLTVAQYAARMGVSTRTVYRWLAAGMPRLQRAPKHTVRIVPRLADAWLLAVT